MKKVTVFILTFILFIPIVNGKNINDLYSELNALENQKNLYSYLNSEDIKSLSNNGLDIQIIIDSLNDEINELDKEITSKEEFINSLKEEIDNVMVYNQVSQGENIYLEYIFAAETYSDMVYRYMIAEQISNYNNTMIEEMNKEIEELNKKKEELNEKINKLGKERSKYRELEVILKSVSYLDGDSINSSIDDDITSIKKEIALYESIGCSKYMDISACLNIRDGGNFIFPLDKGCVSQDYLSNHKGIDLACNGEGTNVYSSAKGVVSSITYKATYGGNIVYIYHIIGGKQYTTIYGHLLEVKVNVGDVVDTDTVIGLVGGESTAYINGGYDKGTKGAHLHYVVVEGFHVNDFSSYTLNPRYFNTYPGILNGYFRRKNA